MKYQCMYVWLLAFTFCVLIFSSLAWPDDEKIVDQNNTNVKTAIFAGGCFWCMEPPYDKLDGVLSTESGYTGGHINNPTYKQVSKDNTGHYEAVKIIYDPTQVNYETLLAVFWHNVDPLNVRGQFCDNGDSYRTAIFYLDQEQQKLAIQSKNKLDQSEYFNEPVVTKLLPAKTFFPAEDYHQDYYQKNPIRYNYYRFACGRDKRLKELWGESAGKAGLLIPTIKTANE